MITQIVKQVLYPLVSSIDWVGFCGGLTVKTTRVVDNDGETEVFPCSVFPVTGCLSSSEPIVAPDDRYMSVVWFEENGGAVSIPDPRFAGGKALQFTQNLTVYGWLNGKALGNQGYYFAYGAATDLIGRLNGLSFNRNKLDNIGLSQDINISRLQVSVVGEREKKSDELFTEYTFGQSLKWFTAPYDYFGIDLTVTWTVMSDCLPVYDRGTPEYCPPETVTNPAQPLLHVIDAPDNITLPPIAHIGDVAVVTNTGATNIEITPFNDDVIDNNPVFNLAPRAVVVFTAGAYKNWVAIEQ